MMINQFYKILDLNKKVITYNGQIYSIQMTNPNMVYCLNEEGFIIAAWPVSQIYCIELVQTGMTEVINDDRP